MFKKLLLTTLVFHTLSLFSQNIVTEWNTPSAGNPFIPGYFADPTIRKFGDTYYIYATTDERAMDMVQLKCGCRRIL